MGKEKIRKVFLDELPRWEYGTNKGKINWTNCIGSKVKFIYNNTYGEVKIIDYNRNKKQYLTILYNGNEFEINTGNFTECKLNILVLEKTKEFKIDIGTKFKDEKRDLVITDREYRKDKSGCERKWYKYTCNVCKWTEGWIVESSLKRGQGCSCCNSKTVVEYINSIWVTDRWMVDLGLSEEDAKKYTSRSNKKIEVICPYCKNKKSVCINDIYNYKTINCICEDKGMSYPEKFMVSILNQLNLDFITQLSNLTLLWCDKYKYDFYLPEYNIIIETHGKQHYEESNRGRSLKEEQENDRIKQELALSNGIKHYVIIDCRNSEMEWIKQYTINSELNEIFDLSKIDWSKCEKFALPNLIKEVCDYWNNKEEWETTQTIADNNPWGIKDKTTIRKYLKKGTELGWTNYNPKKELRRCGQENGKTLKKPIEIFKDNKSLGRFESAYELERISLERFGTKLYRNYLRLVCKGVSDNYKGFTFRYI